MMARMLAMVALGFVVPVTDGEDDATKDRKKLQGTWQVLKIDRPGNGPDEYFQKYGRVVIEGDKLTLMLVEKDQRTKVLECTFKVKPGKTPGKTPRAIDLTIEFISILLPDTEAAKNLLKDLKGKTILGIYGLDEDTLKFFFSGVGEERPKRFPTKAGEGVITLRRAKP